MATQRAQHAQRLAEYRKAAELLTDTSGETTRLATLQFGIRHE